MPRIHVAPQAEPVIAEAIERAGGTLTDDVADAEAIVWRSHRPDGLPELLHPGIRWVQLPAAGVDAWIDGGVIDDARVWTSAAGVYSAQLAEHALALTLALARRLGEAARATHWDSALEGGTLDGTTVLVVGAGGIGTELIRMLAPLGVEVIAVTRSGRDVEGAATALPADRVAEAWGAADVIVLAAPATAETRHVVDERAIAAMRDSALLVNVARGSLIDTDALVRALDEGRLGGAALDVTDPEPLPDGHPLWTQPRALVTPHVGNPSSLLAASVARRVEDNVTRFAAGDELLGVIDLQRGY